MECLLNSLAWPQMPGWLAFQAGGVLTGNKKGTENLRAHHNFSVIFLQFYKLVR
jgi:hypothetical protein